MGILENQKVHALTDKYSPSFNFGRFIAAFSQPLFPVRSPAKQKTFRVIAFAHRNSQLTKRQNALPRGLIYKGGCATRQLRGAPGCSRALGKTAGKGTEEKEKAREKSINFDLIFFSYLNFFDLIFDIFRSF